MLSEAGASTPGRLRHRVVIETATLTPDGAGGETLAWNAVATVSAELTPMKADEREVGEGLGDLTLFKIVIRKRDDVAAGDRLRLGTRIFRIRGASDAAEDGRYLMLVAEEEGSP